MRQLTCSKMSSSGASSHKSIENISMSGEGGLTVVSSINVDEETKSMLESEVLDTVKL